MATSAPHIQVRPAVSEDLGACQGLANQVFGYGYWSAVEYQITLPESTLTVAVNADESRLLGFVTWQYRTTFPRPRNHQPLPPNFLQFPSLWLGQIVVIPQARRQGIARQLYQSSLAQITAQTQLGLPSYTLVWKESPAPGILPFLTHLAWTPVIELPCFWQEDSITRGYGCIRCGTPCQCTACLMVSHSPEEFSTQLF